MMPGLKNTLALLTTLVLCAGGCTDSTTTATTDASDQEHSHGPEGDHSHAPAMAQAERIAIPRSVQQNLGITFVEVSPRRVEQTLRVPGRFEYLPTAQREYRLPIAGRVELLVEQFERVNAGDAIYRIDSLQWRELQQQLTDAGSMIDRYELQLENYEPLIEAHEMHEASLQRGIAVLEQRVAQLQSVRDAGGGRVSESLEARSALALAQSELAGLEEKHVELEASRNQATLDLEAARSRKGFLLGSASSIVGLTRAQLLGPTEHEGRSVPYWTRIETIEIRAMRDGIVESLELTNGSWGEQQTPVVRIVRPEMLRFRASALQSDLGVLRDGLRARIVPPTPSSAAGGLAPGFGIEGSLRLGLAADPEDRTLDLFVTPESLQSWARNGVSAQLEIVTDVSAMAMPAIPLGAVQRDGLTAVVFQRDPFDPQQAIRVEVTLGRDDGRWVEVLDGVDMGNEIVLDGAFQLLLASSGSIQQGGHFHSDGTFHEGED